VVAVANTIKLREAAHFESALRREIYVQMKEMCSAVANSKYSSNIVPTQI